MKFSEKLLKQMVYLQQKLYHHNLKITCAESCTGGLLSALFTEISGSSRIFERGFVAYSNHSKIDLLGVDDELIDNFGAVSYQVATAMAKGALAQSRADIAIAITGFVDLSDKSSNPDSGVVFIALIAKNYHKVEKFIFKQNRHQNRELCLENSLILLQEFLDNNFVNNVNL